MGSLNTKTKGGGVKESAAKQKKTKEKTSTLFLRQALLSRAHYREEESYLQKFFKPNKN
jgi:hypothetical protein